MRKTKFQSSQGLILSWFVLSDILGLTLGLYIAYYFRFGTGYIRVIGNYAPIKYLQLYVVAVPVWLYWLNRGGCYSFLGRAFNRRIMHKITRACFKATLTFVVLHFFTRNLEYSRYVYLMGFVGSVVFLGITRFATDRILAMLRHKRVLLPPCVAIVGLHELGIQIVNRVERHSLLNMQIEGFIRLNGDDPHISSFGGLPILGNVNDLARIVREHSLSEIIINAPELSPNQMLDIVFECEKFLVTVRVAPNLLQDRLINLEVEQIDEIPLFGLKASPLSGRGYLAKRVFDLVIALPAALVLALPMLVIALLIRSGSKGPAIYTQKRVSLDGKEFTIYKFRTMHINSGSAPTAPNDKRVTKIGRFLRSTSLDELPQLFNVIKGDMSLVGPRPERPFLVRELRERVPRYMGRLRMPAGITGLAQVRGLRQGTSLEKRINCDLEYIENWSIWLDIKILLQTLFILRRNAY